MKKVMKTIAQVFILVVIAGGLFFGGSYYADTHNQTQITSSVIESHLQDSQDLIATKYLYSHLEKYENSLSVNGWKVPLTKKTFLLQFNGEIHAGIDLSKIKVDVSDHQIIVNTPNIQILSNTIDEESIQIYDEDNNLFNPIHISDYKKFAVQQKKIVLKEAKQKGLMKKAASSTKKTIKNLIYTIPDTKDTYTVTVNIGANQNE